MKLFDEDELKKSRSFCAIGVPWYEDDYDEDEDFDNLPLVNPDACNGDSGGM